MVYPIKSNSLKGLENKMNEIKKMIAQSNEKMVSKGWIFEISKAPNSYNSNKKEYSTELYLIEKPLYEYNYHGLQNKGRQI